MKEFETIAILGGGLLGGSLALALQDRLDVRLWARRPEAVEAAQHAGIRSVSTSLAKTIAGADLLVLSVPVGAMRTLVDLALDAGLGPATLVTDVGSVKRVVHRELAFLKERGIPFIGGHPMAGSEKRGVESSQADLFSGAACLLTDDAGVGEPWTSSLESFWSRLDCRVSWTSASAHDELVARISHFPHLMAAATATISLRNPGDAGFGGGGLRDTTRVAGGDPGMWAEILMENRDAVAASVSASIETLEGIQDALCNGDHERIHEWLERAFDLHRQSRQPSLS